MFKEDLFRLQKLLLRIPRGRVATYGGMAGALRMPKSARYVGFLLKSNPEPDRYPCYKVVRSDGAVGGYSGSGGSKEKIRRLGKENVMIKKGKVVDFESKIFNFYAPTCTR